MSHMLQGRSGRRLRAAVFCLGVILLVASASPAAAIERDAGGAAESLAAMPRQLTHTFRIPAYDMATDDAGYTTVQMEGFRPAALPGSPALPVATYHLALPPFVALDSVRLEIDTAEQAELPGVYEIAPVGPFLPAGDGQPAEPNWGPDRASIVDGRNVDVYTADAYYPAAPVELTNVAHMRKWRIVELRFWPVSYNPVQRRLRVTSRVTVTLRYDAPALRNGVPGEAQDTLMDDRAAESLLNYAEARPWYDSLVTEQARAAAAKPGYVIITTNQIVSATPALSDFVAHKAARGFTVQVITEDDYGPLTGDPPNQRADKVRQWLGDHWKSDNLLYALLIGNPDPDDPSDPNDSVGDMPMKMDALEVPTDFYFADLYATDPSNFDWWAEVYVGRIPVYQTDGNWPNVLNGILHKTISYENATAVDWRRSVLMPMAFLDVGADGAELGEYMKTDYLDDEGFVSHRMYWHGALAYSAYASEDELVDGAVRARLQQQPFGVMVTYGHGNATGMAIYEEYTGQRKSSLGAVLTSNEVQYLDDSRPAMTLQVSCQTGTPEEPENLGYALLRRGAVGSISGSRVTYGWPYGDPGTGMDNVSFAYNYVRALVVNEPEGKALYSVKVSPNGDEDNALAYNLYGDPSVRLRGDSAVQAQVQPPLPGTSPNNGTRAWEAARGDNARVAFGTSGDTVQASAAGIEDMRPASAAAALGPKQPAFADPEQVTSMGFAHSCATDLSGDVHCWGDKWGFTDTWDQAVDQTGPYVQVSAALYHTCGLRADGSVHCWGRDDYDLGLDRPGPYSEISTNYLHICGLTTYGTVECWGNNDAGQLDVSGGSFIQVSAGLQHTCALTWYGAVKCWGRNSFGQANNRTGPYTQIESGYYHTCGLRPDGSVDCWGSNHHGQAVDKPGPFLQISTSFFHTCGLMADGSLDCWGKNEYGQASDAPGPFVQISTGYYQTAALDADGRLHYFGGWLAEQPGPYGQYRADLKRMIYTSELFGEGSHYTAMRLAELTGHGQPELLIGNRSTRSLEIWRYSLGANLLVQADSISLPNDVHDVRAADFDGDGDVDLVVGLRGFGLYYVANIGGPGVLGNWDARELAGGYVWQVLVEDFDQDGQLDVFAGMDNGPIETFYGDGKGNFVPGEPVFDEDSDMRFTHGFNAVDVNDDDLPDLIGVDGSFMRAYLNPGNRADAWDSVGPDDPLGSYPCCEPRALMAGLAPSAGDLDGNGVVDQVAFLGSPETSGPVRVLLFEGDNYGDGPFWEETLLDNIVFPGWAGHVGVADLDGDGHLDVHVGGWNRFNGLHLYFGDGKGGFTAETAKLDHGVGEFNSTVVGDLNGDGVMDVVTNRFTAADGANAGFEVLYGTRPPRSLFLPFIRRAQ